MKPLRVQMLLKTSTFNTLDILGSILGTGVATYVTTTQPKFRLGSPKPLGDFRFLSGFFLLVLTQKVEGSVARRLLLDGSLSVLTSYFTTEIIRHTLLNRDESEYLEKGNLIELEEGGL